MDWYVIDAIGVSYERTKKCLFKPFDLWKWVKLAMVLALVGGGGGHGGNLFNSFSNSGMGSGYGHDHISDYDPLGPIDGAIASMLSAAVLPFIMLLLLLIIVLMYISSVMEFVLVESLVSNNIRFWEYTRRFLGRGFQLFLIRTASLLLFLLVLALAVLPFIFVYDMPSGDHLWLSLIGGVMMVVFLLIVFVIIASVLGSFISMSIPVAMYCNIGVLSAILEVLRKFRLDWQQIVVYWVGRAVLGAIVGIGALAITILVVLITLIPFLILDIIVYSLSSLFLSGFEWMVLLPLVLVEMIFFIIAMTLASMPFGAFLKYHMLSFVEKWYPEASIPFGQGIDIKAEETTGFLA
ncbi:hypothetical protein [Methanomethylovorans sp.]|uniref:DUF7544 domain-containing protein n=1 Tax=Methanomethylovorans sp. TaxID=2758717 RepID=UPI000AF92CCF|nr:hypothetical protein [Methanomethylovorans sp.]